MNDRSDQTTDLPGLSPEDPPPWWCGTVIPTGRYRLKLDPWGKPHLQHLITDTGGRQKRWVYIQTAKPGASDDE